MSKEKPELLEAGLLTALRALDNQVAREMQRTPEKLEAEGVQKWEPYAKRVESVSALLLDFLGDNKIELDSLLILTQALSKALSLAAQDLGVEGLGKLRSEYCRKAFEALESDAHNGGGALKAEEDLH